MKLFTFTLLLLTVQIASAKTWRVNNNLDIQADFRTLADAHIGASPGDTIYLEPSLKCYGGFSWSKRLVLIGTGYFLTENSYYETNNHYASICSDITFNPGSEGSEIMGISIWNNTVHIKCSNLRIKKNQIKNISIPRQAGVRLNNLFITQNYLNSVSGGASYGTDFFVDDLIFSNNIVVYELDFTYSKYKSDCPCYNQALTGKITNNVFLGTVYLESCEFRNNVFYKSDLSTNFLKHLAFNIVEENIFARVLPWADVINFLIPTSNIDNANMTTLFEGGGSPDGKWRIKPSSTIPIKDICGAYTGLEPYVLSGIPSVPAIYYLNVPYTGNKATGLDISIKVRSNQ
jgi:hypothetical protein